MSATLLFNPAQASTEELERTFVGRHELLQHLEKNILADRESLTPRHWQLVGPRGSGKSHLTELLARRMSARQEWRIARLPEENYHIGTLGELLEQIVIRAEGSRQSPFHGTIDELQLQERALDRLRGHSKLSPRPLLVVLENLGTLFERQLRSSRDQARLRDILTNQPPFTLVATSTSQSDTVTRHSAPFYDFFHTVTLEDLTSAHVTELVRARADWEQNTSLLANFEQVRGRLEAIYHLSGGNPRLALALYTVVQDGVTVELHQQVMKLLDEVTPYYQARLGDIPPQALRVLTEMAVSEMIVTPAETARRCRMPTNQVTAQIRKLLDERLVVQGGRPNARSRYYEFKDRLLRIWIQMRQSSNSGKRLRFLTEFFERWYAGCSSELESLSRRTFSSFWSDLVVGDERRCGDQLKTLSYLAEMKPGLDDSIVRHAMSEHVNKTSESDVRAHLDALRRTFERTADLRERECVAFLLSQCHIALDAENESRQYLKLVIDEGSQSELIAHRYARTLLADNAFEEASSFSREWLQYHPSHSAVRGPCGVACCALGRPEEGFDLIEQYLQIHLCARCTERLLHQAVSVLGSQMTPDLERKFGTRFLAIGGLEEVPDEAIQAAVKILRDEKPTRLPPGLFLQAAKVWKSLSGAPWWFLCSSLCGLAHRSSYSVPTLEIVSEMAERTPKVLGQAAVDHLVEILPELRHSREKSEEMASAYARAIILIQDRTTPETLATAFRFIAPIVPRRFRQGVRDLIELYTEWRAKGLITEPITPYAETVAVLEAHEPSKVIQSFHPETRDAVSLLLGAFRDEEKPTTAESAKPATQPVARE